MFCTPSEAAALSGLPEAEIRERHGERVPAMALLGLVCACWVAPLLPDAKCAADIGFIAAGGARADGNRSLVVTFRDGQPVASWFSATDPASASQVADRGSLVRRPYIVLPADAMLSDMTDALLELRQVPARAH